MQFKGVAIVKPLQKAGSKRGGVGDRRAVGGGGGVLSQDKQLGGGPAIRSGSVSSKARGGKHPCGAPMQQKRNRPGPFSLVPQLKGRRAGFPKRAKRNIRSTKTNLFLAGGEGESHDRRKGGRQSGKRGDDPLCFDHVGGKPNKAVKVQARKPITRHRPQQD